MQRAVLASCGSSQRRQAQLTFAMARHAVVDLSQIFGARPRHPAQGRLRQADWEQMRQMLGPVASCDSSGFEELTRLRSLDEPYLERWRRIHASGSLLAAGALQGGQLANQWMGPQRYPGAASHARR